MNKALQTVLEFRLRIVTEKFPRFGNVGAGQRHVARLLRQPVDLCFFAECLFDRGDQVFQLNRFTLAQIENVKHRVIVFKSGHRPLDDVVDVSVVAARRAVAKLIDRFVRMNFSGELMDREIGTLPRSVNGEVAQRDDSNFVEMRVSRAEKLTTDFRSRIGLNVWVRCSSSENGTFLAAP